MFQQCLPSAQQQQPSNVFVQPANQLPVKSSFQPNYETEMRSPMSLKQCFPKQLTDQLIETSNDNSKTFSKSSEQASFEQMSVQSSQKQPSLFSMQAYQNDNSSSMLREPVGQQLSSVTVQDNASSGFQNMNSIKKQERSSVNPPTSDLSGVCSAKNKLKPVKNHFEDVAQLSVGSLDSQDENIMKKTIEAAVISRDRSDSSINYEWAVPIMANYVLGVLENSHKMMVLFVIIAETVQMGDKLLVFSQSLSTLDLLEQFLIKIQVPRKVDQSNYVVGETWIRNKNYFRLDGSTSAQEREKLINEFNQNRNVSLFLLSTRAGCLGINLVGANRIVVMDASWNPCHDAQAVCRIYRYGQRKQCYIYRLVTDNSLEKRIYDRQVNKQGMSDRVVDELNPESNFTWKDVTTLIQDNEDDGPVLELSKFAPSYTDKVLKFLVTEMSSSLSKEPFEHESLLLDRKDLKLTKQEKRLAKQSYEMAKRANTINIRTTYTYLPSATGGGGQFIINNKPSQWIGGTTIKVLPNQTNSHIVNPRLGTTATPITASPSLMSSLFKQGVMVQKLTMPSNVSIPVLTPGAPPVVIPAGQDVLVLRTPKGVYLRLPDGRIIAVQLPPSLLAKTQFRPNVLTHFRPAVSKGGNQPTVINTPRGQSIGIIKQTLQCGGTVRYLGPRNAAGSSGINTNRSSAPEVIDLSDDDEPTVRKHRLGSNSFNSSTETESRNADSEKSISIFPGKHITIRRITPLSKNTHASKEKCDIPQVLSKNKQITIMPINPSSKQSRSKFAPELTQANRVQHMFMQAQQAKQKSIKRDSSKLQMSPLCSVKGVCSQSSQPNSFSLSMQSQKEHPLLALQHSKNLEISKKSNEPKIIPEKQTFDSTCIKASEHSSKFSTTMSQQFTQRENMLSESEKKMLPPSLAALAMNNSLHITPSNRESTDSSVLSQKSRLKKKPSDHIASVTSFLQSDCSNLEVSSSHSENAFSDSVVLKMTSHTKSPIKNKNIASNVLKEQENIALSKSSSHVTETEKLNSKSESFLEDSSDRLKSPLQNFSNIHGEHQQNLTESNNPNFSSQQNLTIYPSPVVSMSSTKQTIENLNTTSQDSLLHNLSDNVLPQVSASKMTCKSPVVKQSTSLDSLSTLSQISSQQYLSSTQSKPLQLASNMTNLIDQSQPRTSISSVTHCLDNAQMSFPSPAVSLSVSQNDPKIHRKRKHSNKQSSNKSQQYQHQLMFQNRSQTIDSSPSFHHQKLSNNVVHEKHLSTISDDISVSDFTPFSKFPSHKSSTHIQHPQPVHPLHHNQEHSLLPHLQCMSHLYSMPPHFTETPNVQSPSLRPWPIPQSPVSSFMSLSQSPPFFNTRQDSQFPFTSSFSIPSSTMSSSFPLTEANANVPKDEISTKLDSSNM